LAEIFYIQLRAHLFTEQCLLENWGRGKSWTLTIDIWPASIPESHINSYVLAGFLTYFLFVAFPSMYRQWQ